MVSLSDQYRHYAAECLRIAQQTHEPGQKVRLIEMAEAWKNLAAERDKRESNDFRAVRRLLVRVQLSDLSTSRRRGTVAFDPETPLIFSGEGKTGLFKAEAFFARDGRLIKLCIVGEEGTTIDSEICVSAVTLAVSMGKTKMRPTSTREPPRPKSPETSSPD